MSEKALNYYQFQKDLGYQVYLQFDDSDFEGELELVISSMGFQKVDREAVIKQNVDRKLTKVLKVTKANTAVSKLINKSDYMLDKYGDESISNKGSYNIYRYKNTGMMIYSLNSSMWELGLDYTKDKENELRVILTRFLSFSLSASEVVGFWGVPLEDGFVVMKPVESNFESVFVDMKQKVLITSEGVKSLDEQLRVLRLDDASLRKVRGMRKRGTFELFINKYVLYVICRI